MTETATDAELMQEVHWCPWCEGAPGTKPTSIDRSDGSPALIVHCKTCGDHRHDPHDTDCWCLK